MEFECVPTFPAVLRTMPGLGQNVITVCSGYATVCDGTFPEALRCVTVSPDTPRLCLGIGGRAPVSLGGSRKLDCKAPVLHGSIIMHINDISVELITNMSFAKYRT